MAAPTPSIPAIQKLVAVWGTGSAKSECLSLLRPHVANLSVQSSATVLYDALHTLVRAMLPSSRNRLTPAELAPFVQSLLQGTPSSSSAQASPQPTFVDILLDVVWTLDAGIEERSVDAGALCKAEDDKAKVAAAHAAKASADSDKASIAEFLKHLLNMRVLPSHACRKVLELPLLSEIWLVTNEKATSKFEVRVRTAMYYKQNKFNLLREQSEGYSKLTTELVSLAGPSHSSETGEPVESKASLQQRAKAAWNKVVSLIGYFDLDPNRALDIIIDIFAAHVITHHGFFLELIRRALWSRSVRPEDRDAMEVDTSFSSDAKGKGRYVDKGIDEILLMAERPDGVPVELEEVPREPAASVCGQLLGFKFAQYQSPDATESTPRNLYFAAALLIREDFVKLEELYPHLTPLDENMSKVLSKYHDTIKEKIASARTSALAVAGSLDDSGPSKPSSAALKKPASTGPKDPPNQKFGLLKALLSLGAIRQSLFFLSKFPWMTGAHPEIADLLLRILHVSLEPVYESFSFSTRNPQAASSNARPRARYVPGNPAPVPLPRKSQLTVWAPVPPSTALTDFVFFYPKWTQWIPRCTTVEEIMYVIEPLMRFVGVHGYRDISFLSRLCRIGSNLLIEQSKSDIDKEVMARTSEQWLNISRLFLLPALSMVRSNAAFTVEVWNVLRHFDITERWGLYGEWSEMPRVYPELQVRNVEVSREVKAILRRVTVTRDKSIDSNGNKLSLPMAKLAHANPCTVFLEAVKQVQAYDNLVEPIAEAARSLTTIGYDVLIYAILAALSNQNRPRMKEDGMSVAMWLQNLALFTGTVFKKFSAMDPSPMLQYVANQLRNNQSKELLVLRELIARMTNIEPQENLSDDQVVCMGGGPVLRIEALAKEKRGALSAKLQAGNTIGARRLITSLNKVNLTLPLLIEVAQQRESCVFTVPEHETHLKYLSNLFDECQAVLFQYVELLVTALSPADYASMLPSLYDLCKKYKIQPSIAFHILRPALHEPILAHNLALHEQKEKETTEAAEKRLKNQLEAKRGGSPSSKASKLPAESPAEATPKDGDAQMVDETEAPLSTDNPELPSPWLPQLAPVIEHAKEVMSPAAAKYIGAPFYVTFWQLSMYDINPPVTRYKQEMDSLKKLMDRSSQRDPTETASEHRRAKDLQNSISDSLVKEVGAQAKAHAITRERLHREKMHWFRFDATAGVVHHMMQECIYPRALLSPVDAEFCAQFIKFLHKIGTPGFSTLKCYNTIIGEQISSVIFTCTENEARNYGRFLRNILSDIAHWPKDENAFGGPNRKTVNLLPGFQMRWSRDKTIQPQDIISLVEFQQLTEKLHKRLCYSVVNCLESREHMRVRNTILILTQLLPVFPSASACGDKIGSRILAELDILVPSETRPDLKAIANSYQQQLLHRRSIWDVSPPKPSETQSKPSETPAPAPPTGSARQVPATPSAPNVPPSGPKINGNGTPRDSPAPTVKAAPPPTQPAIPTNGRPSADKPLAEVPSSSSTDDIKAAIESIPRPSIVKRVPRTDSPTPGSSEPRQALGSPSTHAMAAQDAIPNHVSSSSAASSPTPSERRLNGIGLSRPATPSGLGPRGLPPRPPSPLRRSQDDLTPKRDPPRSPRGPRKSEEITGRQAQLTMPPPTAPSSTISAQGLRAISSRTGPSPRSEKPDSVAPQQPNSVQARSRGTPTSPASSGRRRSASPPPRRSRDASADSRSSQVEGRPRSDRDDGPRANRDKHERDDGHRGDKNTKDRPSKEDERGRESDRDRHRGRGRDSSHRDRDREREGPRDREREREKEREKERDKDDRERDRDRDRGGTRKDRERERGRDANGRRDRDREPPSGPSRGLSRRESMLSDGGAGRNRDSIGDDASNKRRRLDDEERGISKRSRGDSGRDRHHDDRAPRREKERERDKDKDKEREREREREKERDKEKDQDKHPEGDGSKRGGRKERDGRVDQDSNTERSSKEGADPTEKPNPPSAPRAMATAESRKADAPPVNGVVVPHRPRDPTPQARGANRPAVAQTPSRTDLRPQPASSRAGTPGGRAAAASTPAAQPAAPGSLMARISAERAPLGADTPTRGGNSNSGGLAGGSRDEGLSSNNNNNSLQSQDTFKKRNLSERSLDTVVDVGQEPPAPKKPRFVRNQYPKD
ncbi:hypothetical protein BOTBODRAFT_32521 [Botryobasidium botryosum FD-172 SS1]|uniref:THO complex subunit 2 n=1 Tax=Botryobasidium botryosum (strain FD-172 SS1) TaxID=930990 RepID=A0A067MSE2_BOTB1|nr:hypothetical protein BOTBODRAFT_32521 [Botryobasidium botryosum FD-172 SS1]